MKKYQLGDKWSNDFDYDGLIRSCNDADVSWGADKLEKLYDSLVDVNYHDLARDVDKAVEHLRREDEGDMAVAIESLDKVRETIKKDYFEHESGYVNTEVDEEGNERVVLYDDKGESKGSFASEKQALKYAKEIGLSPDVMAKGGEVRRSPIRKLAFEMFNKEYSELSSKDQKQVEDKREDLMDKDYNAYKKKYYAKGGSTKAEYVVTLSNPADSTPSGKKSFTLKASSPEEARKIATDIIKKDFGYYVSIGYRDIRIKRKMAKGGYIPFEERADFFDYVSAFYGAGGIYAQSYNGGFEDDEIKVAIDKYIQDPNTNWGGGDSVDRELMRDRYLAPTYAKGGEIKPRRKRKFDIGNRDKRQKVDTISGDRAMTVRYYNKGKFGVEKLVSIERGLREINDNIRYGVPYEDYSRNNQIHYEFFNNNDNRSLANRKSAIFETKLMAKGGALDKEFKFTKNFVIYVPSTSNVGDTISKSELEKRVKEVEKYVADEFGGYTETETEGGYKSTSGDIIEEDVVKVSVFAQNDDWQKNEGKVVAKVKEWANKWGQEAIGFEYEGDLYYIDDDGKFTLGGVLMAGIAGYVGYKIGRARPQKKGFETEKAVGRKFGKKFKRKKKMAEGGGLKKNMKVWDVFKDGVLQGRVKTSRTDEEGVIEFYLNSISKRVLKPTIKKHWSAKVSDEKYQFAKGGQIDNAYLNASKKDELFIEAVKNGKVIEYPIKAKTVKSIEKQVDELYDEKGVEEVRLVRYWNSSREGGVDDVTYFAKGGNVQFRKLAKSKNFDIVTDEGRYEIEMGAFDMPKNIIDGDTRKEINTHPIAKKYRSEIQKYLDDNYAEGGLIEIDGKMYRVITKHRYNSDGIYEPFDVYEEVEKNSYAEGGEITVDDVDEWEVISDWASWKEIYPKYNVSYGQVVSDISDFLAFFMGDSEEDEHEIWKKRYNLKVVDKQTMRSLEKELWEHLVKKAKEENAFQDYVDFWNKSNKKRMADIPENYYFVREDNDNYVYVFKHKGTGKELKVNASHIGEITNKIHRLNKDRALQIHFDKKSGSTYAEGGGVDLDAISNNPPYAVAIDMYGEGDPDDIFVGFYKDNKKYGGGRSYVGRGSDKNVRWSMKDVFNDGYEPKIFQTIEDYRAWVKGGKKMPKEKVSLPFAKGGEVEMIEIAEDGSNVPPKLMEVFSEFNEDEDPYKEMEKLRAMANQIGYDFSYGLDGTPTEFCEIPKKSWGGGIAIGTAVGGYVGYKIGRARKQKYGFDTERKIGKGIKKTFSKKK